MGQSGILEKIGLGNTLRQSVRQPLIYFTKPTSRAQALAAAPWYMFRRFVFTITWDPTFDVHRELQSKAPIWVELPYRALILERSRKAIIEALGLVLHLTQGEDCNSYPHNRACILWDLTKKAPKWLKLWLDPNHFI